jgi:multicomponent Na+:H+ antiporter subunit D
MDIITSSRPLLAVAVSVVAAVLIVLTGKRAVNLRETWTILAAVIKFALVGSMVPWILSGKVVEYTLISIAPGLLIQFRVDGLGIFFALTASLLWLITSFYSIGYMRAVNEHAQTRYFVFFALALSATMGVAFSANLFTTFLFYELITLSTYPLVAHKQTPEALKGARRYVTYLLGTSVAFQLFAIFLTYNAAGTLDFAGTGILAGKAPDAVLILIFALFMAGIAKAAMMPFHSWLPAAMVAPTPVSALLHAVAVVKTGVFVVVKVVLHVFGVDLLARLGLGTVLASVASFTIITASLIALRKDNLKARLAYSTVSQLSYVVLGAALLTPSAVTGSIMHIVLHAFGKITLFFAAGAIYVAAHKTEVSQLDGIGRRMPFTMGAFSLAALSMVGVPPLGGFLSKWYIAMGSLEAGQLAVLLVIVTSTVLNAGYFMPIVYAAFFREAKPEQDDRPHAAHSALRKPQSGIHEAPALMVVPLVLTAAGTVVLFFRPSLFLKLAKLVVAGATGGN